jgi:hypothetical protein
LGYGFEQFFIVAIQLNNGVDKMKSLVEGNIIRAEHHSKASEVHPPSIRHYSAEISMHQSPAYEQKHEPFV